MNMILNVCEENSVRESGLWFYGRWVCSNNVAVGQSMMKL